MSKILPKLYIKTGCPWCTEAVACLDRHGLAYEKINVSSNPAAMQEMVDLTGQTKAPTLDWNGEILADFGEAELMPFLKKLGLL